MASVSGKLQFWRQDERYVRQIAGNDRLSRYLGAVIDPGSRSWYEMQCPTADCRSILYKGKQNEDVAVIGFTGMSCRSLLSGFRLVPLR